MPTYKNKMMRVCFWFFPNLILSFLDVDLKKKWKNLRDVFNREYKKVPIPKSGDSSASAPIYPGRWPHFHCMLFVRDMAQPRKSSSNLHILDESHSSVDDALETELDPDETEVALSESILADMTPSELQPLLKKATEDSIIHVSPNTVRPPKRKKKIPPAGALSTFESELLKKEELKLELLKEPEDDDLNFFKSLLPYFRTMNPIKKLKLRSKIQNLVVEELDSNSTIHSPGGITSSSRSSANNYDPPYYNEYNYETGTGNNVQENQNLELSEVLLSQLK